MDGYAYISMGAYPLEDHKLVYRRLGITRLVSFDHDPEIVKRQLFNRPVANCKCIEKTSGEVCRDVMSVLDQVGYSDADGVILWLDYTSAKGLSVQLREFADALGNAEHGDIIRLTVNANPENLSRNLPKSVSGDNLYTARLAKLRERINDFLPASIPLTMMRENDYPILLTKAIESAVHSAGLQGKKLLPLSIVTYRDGQQMLSVTGMIVNNADAANAEACLDLKNWNYGSPSWTQVHRLSVVDLTVRERLFLEHAILTMNPDEIAALMGFEFDAVTEATGFLASFKSYSRFYPSYLNSDV